jgi:threonine dehydrogenase-like Zn-dependent dehydrogenase
VRAAVYRGAGRLAAEDWPTPSIGAGEVLLRLKGCGLCGSDIAKIVRRREALKVYVTL